jgi:aerobic-type carbon monoxide dehydrogenase small subunit (CoxS/CutS family)
MSERPAGGRWRDPDERVAVELVLNGEPATLHATPRWTLADAVRAHGLTGTHLGCEHGVCGACTVLLDGEPARACLVLALQAEGRRVDTVEALADGDALHPVQEAFREQRALQCGFCTPGFVVLAAWLADRQPPADDERVREVLSSNLCRCTGYGPILAATLAARGGA